MRIWIDTDAGIDDALALLLAAQAPELDIVGVTSVHGNVDAARAATNAKRVLTFAGRDVPVWQGARQSLLGRVYPDIEGHGTDGLGDIGLLDGVPARIEDGFGPAAMIEAARREPLTLVAIGPLTNVALALSIEPSFARRLLRIVIMGGAVRVEGNQTPAAEFNVWCDPEAAQCVLDSGIPQTWIGLDVTMRVVLPSFTARELAALGDPRARLVGTLALRYSKLYQRMYGLDGMALHDPLTIAFLLDPALGVTRPAHLGSELSQTGSRGRTIASLWPYAAGA
jgi:inosine-uridine nucleoside N-ribohydrolase